MPADSALASSFRDPSGFVFRRQGLLYRQVNTSYREHYDHLMASGLYEDLVGRGLLIPHREVATESAAPAGTYKILQPEPLPFVSYPYEWCFSQLKDAALATLRIQRAALDHDMSLKDCSAYNIQFLRGRPVLIDTLSFERYREGKLWSAYGQFCRHFLAPLALMSRVDVRLGQLSRVHLDGVPLDLASTLLPLSTRLSPSLLAHLHLHARNTRQYAVKAVDTHGYRMSRFRFLAMVDSLEGAVRKLTYRPRGGNWADYYATTHYSTEALQHKRELVLRFLGQVDPSPRSVWDLGSNTGLFSRLAADTGMHTISFDADHDCVEQSYARTVESSESHILPLLMDLVNPSPGQGWAGEERMSLLERGPADVAMALALVHHLAIGNNLPLGMIAGFFGRLCRWLIIEFVPEGDPQLQRLLSSREDIFRDYTQQAFEAEFGRRFIVRGSEAIGDSCRTIYLMEPR